MKWLTSRVEHQRLNLQGSGLIISLIEDPMVEIVSTYSKLRVSDPNSAIFKIFTSESTISKLRLGIILLGYLSSRLKHFHIDSRFRKSWDHGFAIKPDFFKKRNRKRKRKRNTPPLSLFLNNLGRFRLSHPVLLVGI